MSNSYDWYHEDTANRYYDSYDRWLAEDKYAKEEEGLDYSVLSVGVMTLGLILFVEVIRHKLDHEAEHRPFFKVVLEATYSECKCSESCDSVIERMETIEDCPSSHCLSSHIICCYLLSLMNHSGHSGTGGAICFPAPPILRIKKQGTKRSLCRGPLCALLYRHFQCLSERSVCLCDAAVLRSIVGTNRTLGIGSLCRDSRRI